jgi:1-acyl-sn-glycerol-3-phosphate acyltransferase
MLALAVCAVLVVLVLLRWRRSGQSLLDFVGLGFVYLYARLWHGCVVRGAAPPARGAALLVANHTCSADPAFLQAGCPRVLCFLMAQEYFDLHPWLRRLFDYMHAVPVKRDGCDVATVRAALRELSAGRLVCIFPEGSLSGAGSRRLRPGKGGAALLALRSGAPVVPAFIAGGPQHSNVPRAWLLPSRVRLTFGPPVDLSAYRGRPINRPLLEEVTAVLMRAVADLDP